MHVPYRCCGDKSPVLTLASSTCLAAQGSCLLAGRWWVFPISWKLFPQQPHNGRLRRLSSEVFWLHIFPVLGPDCICCTDEDGDRSSPCQALYVKADLACSSCVGVPENP